MMDSAWNHRWVVGHTSTADGRCDACFATMNVVFVGTTAGKLGWR